MFDANHGHLVRLSSNGAAIHATHGTAALAPTEYPKYSPEEV